MFDEPTHSNDWTGGEEGGKAYWQAPFGVASSILLLIATFILTI